MPIGSPLSFVIPALGTPFSTAATNVNDALTEIKLVLEESIGSSSIVVDSDFELNAYALLEVGFVQFVNQTSAMLATQTNRVYVLDGELWVSDGVGNQVQITSGGTLDITSAGGIGGDYPTDPTASVTYTDAVSDWYEFFSAAGIYARVKVGSLDICGVTGAPYYIGLRKPAGLAASYDITLPSATPAAQSLMQMQDDGSVVVTNTIPEPVILGGLLTANAGVTAANNQDITVSGAGAFKHGSMTKVLPASSFIVTQGTTSIGRGTIISVGTNSEVTVPISLTVGEQLDVLSVWLNRGTGTATATVYYMGSDGVEHLLISGALSSGAGIQQLSLSGVPLPSTAVVGRQYYLSVVFSNGGQVLYSVEAGYSR